MNIATLLYTAQYKWTSHAKIKMAYYGLSESRVKRVLRNPIRTEEGIAPRTIACMQPASIKSVSQGKNSSTNKKEKTWSQEIWVMAQTNKKGDMTIISAWRYPGKSKPRAPFPSEIQVEIEEAIEGISYDEYEKV